MKPLKRAWATGVGRWASTAPGWWLRFGLAFLLLNTLLTFENRWPGFGVRYMPRLSFELCLAVLALMVWVVWRGVPSKRAAGLLAGGFVALMAVRYADVTAPAVLGRPVNIYWDGQHGLELLRVAAASLSIGQQIGGAVLFGLGLLVLTGLARAAIWMLARCFAGQRPGHAVPVLLTGVAALSISFAAYVPDVRDTRWFFALPLAPTLVQQGRVLTQVLRPEQGEAALGSSPSFNRQPGALAGLTGPQGPADVLLLFAESYGVSSFEQPEQAAALAGPRAVLAQALADSGRGMVSARVTSPTFGGASWLAHASLLSGLPITDPTRHQLLLASQRPTLVGHFARHGYRTVGWQPGIKRPWPEGAFYGFARLADDAGIGYMGPDFGYWRIPDQAAMALLHDQELRPDQPLQNGSPRTPRFAVFATTSTHAPFHPLAPLAADWARLTQPGAYSAAQAAAARAATLAVQQPAQNYALGMGYQFGWLADYVRTLASPALVVVMVGDHQAPALVSGRGASWDVPVHVISSDAMLLQRLQAHGFVPGQQPPATPLGPMHQLTSILLDVFDAPATGSGSGRPPLLGP